MDEEALRDVARIYASAVAAGESPLKAVAAATGLSRATSSRRISAAHRLGYLTAVGGGKPGCVNLRALRIANALGVPYQQLVDAVREHANGDLRVPPDD